ncbi:MAG: class I SAM-dependent methyltransferase [Planctomycetota bacterium]
MFAQDGPKAERSTVVALSPPVEEARRTYQGRIVAKPMSHLGAAWLIRPERNQEEKAQEAFGVLAIEPGMVIADIGCGNGYWTMPMARACKEQEEADALPTSEPSTELRGVVLAVDIQPEMLTKLRRNAARGKVNNIEPVLGGVENPKLPRDAVDLVLMVDVYHEFSHPESMLWHIRNALRPEGVIALLEYRAEDPSVPIKPLHKMGKNQIMKEYAANGLKLVREYNELPWQHLMFFARDDSPLEAIDPEPFLAD